MAVEELVLPSRDDKTVSLAVTPATTPSSAPAAAAAVATFRLVIEQSYHSGGAEDEVDTMEDVACRVPVGKLRDSEGAVAVERAFEELVARLDHPAMRLEVAPEAKKAAAHVQARCAAEGGLGLGGFEFRLRVVLLDSFEEEEPEPEAEDEDTGSDLDFDEESWACGGSDGSDWPYEHGQAALSDDDGGGGQFSGRPYDGALVREGGPSDGTLLLSGFEARSDGPELAEQHELTSRDVQRLVRLAFSGGEVEGDEAYRRALDGGAPVSRVSRAVMLDQALRSARRQAPQQQMTSPSGMPPARMRTGGWSRTG